MGDFFLLWFQADKLFIRTISTKETKGSDVAQMTTLKLRTGNKQSIQIQILAILP